MQSFASEFQTHRVVSEALVALQMVWKLYWCLSRGLQAEPTVLSGELGAIQKPVELSRPEANIVKALFGEY